MKSLYLLTLILAFNVFAIAQQKELITENKVLKIEKINDRFEVNIKSTKKQFKNLKFVKQIAYCYQVLDENNTLFYIDQKGNIQQEVNDFFGVCGNVPHYTLTIQEEVDEFLIYRDETFYDSEDVFPAEIIKRIPKKYVDQLLFINGQTTFNYTDNFISRGCPDHVGPTSLIFKKGTMFGLIDDPTVFYDEILTEPNGSCLLKTRKGNLYGYYGIIAPQFNAVENFKYYLAKVTLKSGESAYIDTEGTIYQ